MTYSAANLRIMVRAGMRRSGLSQSDLAAKIGTSKQQLSAWLRCENTKRSMGERCAEALGIELKAKGKRT